MENKYKNEIKYFHQSTFIEYPKNNMINKIKVDKEIELNNSEYFINQIKLFDLLNNKLRKYSRDLEGLSTSSEENIEKGKNEKKPTNKKKLIKKEQYKANALDFKKKFRTELCKYYEIYGYCQYGNKCAYAHGKENLRLKVTNTSAYRTKKCTNFFEKGYCPYGNRCQFAHELKSNIINNPFDQKMSYTKILEIFSKIEFIGNIQNIVEKPRLQVFKDIVENDEDIQSRLLSDIKAIAFKKNIY